MSDPRTVLLVEDNAIIAMAMRLYLEAKSHRVFVASSASDAVDIARETPLDVCVMDVHLPEGGDGFAAAEGILELQRVSLVFVTGYDDEFCRARADRFDGAVYHVKPMAADELCSVIEALPVPAS